MTDASWSVQIPQRAIGNNGSLGISFPAIDKSAVRYDCDIQVEKLSPLFQDANAFQPGVRATLGVSGGEVAQSGQRHTYPLISLAGSGGLGIHRKCMHMPHYCRCTVGVHKLLSNMDRRAHLIAVQEHNLADESRLALGYPLPVPCGQVQKFREFQTAL